MAVITISRQSGSYGDDIAETVASALGYRLVRKQEILAEGLRREQIDLESVGDIGEGKPPLLDRFDTKKSKVIYAVRALLREIAAEGNAVILGRGGQVELRELPGVFNVRIIADFETRVARVMRVEGVDRAMAVQTIKRRDKDRSEYVKHFFFADVSDPELYDMVLNTRKIAADSAVGLITHLASE